MLQIEILHPDGNIQHIQAPDDCVIGKGAQNEVRLDSWRVAKEHARVFATPSGVLVEDMGAFTGVTVNGDRIDNQHGPLKSSDVIGIGGLGRYLAPGCAGQRRDDRLSRQGRHL